MRALPAALAALALLAAGCGSQSAHESTATLVPPDALAFVELHTHSLPSILDKFPIEHRLLAAIRRQAPFAGQVDAVAVLEVDGQPATIGFLRPGGRSPAGALHATIGGRTVVARSRAALDAVRNRSGSLAGLQAYKRAIATLPGDALATAYVAPGALRQVAPSLQLAPRSWTAAAATAHDDGVELEVHAKGLTDGAAVPSTLAAQIPAGALVAVSLGNARQLLGQAPAAVAGIDLRALLRALGPQSILYVRPGKPLPLATIAALPDDPQAAEATVGRLLTRLTQTKARPVRLRGFPFHRIALGPVSLFYGVFNEELVVSDSRSGVAALQAKASTLATDPTFEAAKQAAGMPDATQGFVYANLQDGAPEAERLARSAGVKLPAALKPNLAWLRSFLLYATRTRGVDSLVAFLQTS